MNQIVLSHDNIATGVIVQRRDGHAVSVIQAKREVILAAGLHTPVIMQRSGIGPRKIIEDAGLEVHVELPGVGMNLQDHPAAGLSYRCKRI